MTTHRLLLVPVLVAGFVAALGVPAAANPDEGQYCVVELTHGDLSGGPVTCFDDFPAAIARATGGAYPDAPDTLAEALETPEFEARLEALADAIQPAPAPRAVARAPRIVVGIEYEHRDFDGMHVIFSGNAVCDAPGEPYEYGQPDLRTVLPARAEGANDFISSFRTYADCAAKHYEHVNYEGVVVPFAFTTAYIGDLMNDQSSAIHWS